MYKKELKRMNESILKMGEPIKERKREREKRERRKRERRRERRKEKGGKRRKEGRSKRERRKITFSFAAVNKKTSDSLLNHFTLNNFELIKN